MPLRLLPVDFTTDIPRLARIHAEAFYLVPVSQALWIKGITPSLISGFEARHRRVLEGDPSARYWKVVDSSAEDNDNSNDNDPGKQGEIVAFAEWHIFNTPEEEALRQDLGPRKGGAGGSEDTDVELMAEFWGHIIEARKRMQGKAHCLLSVVATDPSHHRRGAGALLLDWGTREADSKNLPCFLESSPQGEALYRKFGFEQVGDFTVDLGRRRGITEMYTHLVMIRPAKSGE